MKLRHAVLGATLMGLTACGSTTPSAATVTTTATATVSATQTETAAPVTVTETTTVQPASEATAAAAGLIAWGVPQSLSNGAATLTVHEVKIPLDLDGGPDPSAGLAWAGVDAEICISAGSPDAELSWNPWSLVAGSAMYDASSSTYDAFPKPEYPFVETIASGECGRGWIVFEAPGDGSVTDVRYSNPQPATVKTSEILKWAAK